MPFSFKIYDVTVSITIYFKNHLNYNLKLLRSQSGNKTSAICIQSQVDQFEDYTTNVRELRTSSRPMSEKNMQFLKQKQDQYEKKIHSLRACTQKITKGNINSKSFFFPRSKSENRLGYNSS